ncbi:MAG: GGDEF domain-containing protein, partial [Alphaproteobacteria bacterium]
VPRFGVVAGAIVQVAAAETLKLARPMTDIGRWPVFLCGALLMLGSGLMPRLRLNRAIAIALAASTVLEGAVYTAYALFGFYADTAGFHALLIGIVFVRLLDERIVRLRHMRAQHARLVYLAKHDDDTGALSQQAWTEALDAEIAQGTVASALLLRLEQVDSAGASLGFRLADEAIRRFHDRLCSVADGPVSRIESHVFAIGLHQLLEGHTLDPLLQQLERPYAVAEHRIALKLRWGSSTFVAGKTAATMLQEARAALAMADRTRAVGCAYASEFEAKFERHRQIDIALRSAIARGELDLVFQRQVDAKTRMTVGVEALLRWQNAELGTISPAEFIPLAEENGTIVALGNWVTHEACRRAVEQGWTGRLSINVAPAQFAGSDVIGMVRSALETSSFPADRLDIEVTESLVAGGHLSIATSLETLRALGVSIAIDDFGTGHSALSYLATLSVDKLKIDQSFVRQMGTARGAEVIRAIAALGKGLGLSIVVEGVETEEELAAIAALECNVVQGYIFGRPGPLPDGRPARIEAA